MNVLSTIILHQQVLENHLAAIGVYHFLKGWLIELGPNNLPPFQYDSM
jgi:hypothetical protein